MAQERILISSDWGKLTAELVDNNATRTLVGMLPLTIEMRDHLRQEKTGNLPSPLPAVERRLDFSTGTLGLWSSDHFVIYYRDGRVPQPGIILLGRVTGDVSIFDRPGPVTVRVERVKWEFSVAEPAKGLAIAYSGVAGSREPAATILIPLSVGGVIHNRSSKHGITVAGADEVIE
jgi:Cyclophilin-like family